MEWLPAFCVVEFVGSLNKRLPIQNLSALVTLTLTFLSNNGARITCLVERMSTEFEVLSPSLWTKEMARWQYQWPIEEGLCNNRKCSAVDLLVKYFAYLNFFHLSECSYLYVCG